MTPQTESLLASAVRLAEAVQADALVLLLDDSIDLKRVVELTKGARLLVAHGSDVKINVDDLDLQSIPLPPVEMPVYDKLSQTLLEAAADDLLRPGSRAVMIYSGFSPDTIDSLSVMDMGEHLGRLTVRDLRSLETRVPLETLKTVVDLAVEIGREGREGKPVGTLFVVGDARKVMVRSSPTGFDPVRGYARKERNLSDPRVREGIKEAAQMDGAFIIGADGTVEAAARYIDCPATGLTLSKGLGARHWAAAAVTRETRAVAVAVSESNGTVRIFHNGEVVLRVEPLRRPIKWKEFEFEPPVSE
ncbi:MAG: diadenylate cyclase [Planctomycetales bacterium]|nr:diadenylate cyclase [Planctomycetales bacterium]